ncbi:IS66 family insertion sequence element accessory protein TnpA [Corallococcus sicarius]|uniref:IS66 family insertion sequence element accessory protein TnpA n=1 Tax=Corallococcus sicarius TaxID=2316726 RepID=UPI003F6DFD47
MSKQAEKPEWARVAEAFEASGQTQREFALARGVRLSTLQSWVYRRRRGEATRAEPVRRNRPANDVLRAFAVESDGGGHWRTCRTPM